MAPRTAFAAGATLAEFLARDERARGGSTGALQSLVEDVAATVGAIARLLARGAGREAAQGLRAILADAIAEPLARGAHAQRLQPPLPPDAPTLWARAQYLLAFEPIDGVANIEVDLPAGSLFSIFRRGVDGAGVEGFAQPGARQVCAGYALYGPSTMLVLTLGDGAHGFTLVPDAAGFVLTHPALRTPPVAREIAVDPANGRFWEPAVQHYVQDCLAGAGGIRGRDFDLRWVDSLVADTHRVLVRGGIVLHPRDARDDAVPESTRLLLHANPLAFVAEQAGGGASTGRGRILDVAPAALEARTAIAIGARDEIDLIEVYHRERNLREFDAPLFGTRGLFRVPG